MSVGREINSTSRWWTYFSSIKKPSPKIWKSPQSSRSVTQKQLKELPIELTKHPHNQQDSTQIIEKQIEHYTVSKSFKELPNNSKIIETTSSYISSIPFVYHFNTQTSTQPHFWFQIPASPTASISNQIPHDYSHYISSKSRQRYSHHIPHYRFPIGLFPFGFVEHGVYPHVAIDRYMAMAKALAMVMWRL